MENNRKNKFSNKSNFAFISRDPNPIALTNSFDLNLIIQKQSQYHKNDILSILKRKNIKSRSCISSISLDKHNIDFIKSKNVDVIDYFGLKKATKYHDKNS